MATKTVGATKAAGNAISFAAEKLARSLVDLSSGSQSEPANDTRPPRRGKKWSETLRSADLAELMKGIEE